GETASDGGLAFETLDLREIAEQPETARPIDRRGRVVNAAVESERRPVDGLPGDGRKERASRIALQRCADDREGKSAGTECDLDVARTQAAMAEERSLLIDDAGRHGQVATVHPDLPETARRRQDLRQCLDRHTEQVAELGIPLACGE